MSDEVLVDHRDAIATVVLNRPQKLNALTKSMWRQLGEVLDTLSAEEELRCVILRGAGTKSFSPGNDIGEFASERSNREQARAYGRIMQNTFRAFNECRHPIVAMIHGICVGGGLELAAACDLRICGKSSRFGAPIKRLGLVMALPEIQVLVNLVGRATTLEVLLEGEIMNAEQALAKGLVNRVVADDQVEAEAVATAVRIAEGAPLVARWHKKFINHMTAHAPLSQAEIDEGYACYDTEDFQIGYQSFLKKIKPEFKGR
jgi:enoyl-CoA hydratase